MLSHVDIKNFQSLHEVSVELKPFTVIIGPSSSGKSAFTRALKTLTSNQRGDSFITHGQSQCIITAKTDRGTVAILRGKKNEYVLIPENDSSQQRAFTKLSGNTPEEVSEFIGIPAKDPLNYSNQFDMPYLLTSSAGEVARTLGELTNVSVIFEASREANRQRLQASGELKTRSGDYEALTQNLDRYRSLESNGAKLEQANQLAEQARSIQTRIQRLRSIITQWREVPEVPTFAVPDTAAVERTLTVRNRLQSLRQKYLDATEKYDRAVAEMAGAEQEFLRVEEEHHEVLRDAGSCPTCGQVIA